MARNPTFEALLRSRNATFAEWLGVPVIERFDNDDDEYAVAAGDVDGAFGLADHSSRGTVVAIGTEVVPLLQGIVTSDVFALAEPGAGQHSTAVNSKGRLICDLRILHGPDDILVLDFAPGLVEDGVVSHFRANVMSEDAKFIDRSAATSVLGVYGTDALPGEFTRPPANLAVHHGTWGSIAGHDVIVRRSELGHELLCSTDDAAAIWEHIEAAGGRPVGAAALEVLRVEAGVPRWGAELDPKIIPLEAGLDHTISYDKGCYVGQEIIARLDTLGRPAKLLRKLQIEGSAQPGDTIFDGEKKVGELRTLVESPQAGLLGLAYVKRDHNDVGHVVQVGDAPATVVELRQP